MIVWLQSLLFLLKNRGVASSDSYLNVYGEPLQPCSGDGMALTGYTRNGHCIDQNDDAGSHHVCINLSSIASTGKNFCEVTGQSDWCSASLPCNEDITKSCIVENWCVCQWAFASYLDKAGGCDAIQAIQCDAVNMQAVKAYRANESQYGDALDCIVQRCNLSTLSE
ncbi:predicted protein [Thalassiosira pseudonana CCMP1335]|uniref:Lysozyme n=1 Tax=Thalassiosira pseudonana TaxID=35128 RepID=B8BXR4_THAPS|nr:predicted protein [Thalassiosira pseudonana CCMP1335]EED94253.1 predicted protein [Thalassiosira pseudonana CCMP1335]